MRCIVLHLPKYIIFYPIWFKIMEVTNTLKVTMKKEGREGKRLIFFGNQAKSITKLFILTFYALYHLLICKLVLWIPKESFKNAVEIHAVLHFFQHLVSNMLIRGEAIRTKLITHLYLLFRAFPKCWRKLTKSACQRAVSSCHTRCEEIHGIWLVSPVPTQFMTLSIKLSERVTVSDCKW